MSPLPSYSTSIFLNIISVLVLSIAHKEDACSPDDKCLAIKRNCK